MSLIGSWHGVPRTPSLQVHGHASRLRARRQLDSGPNSPQKLCRAIFPLRFFGSCRSDTFFFPHFPPTWAQDASSSDPSPLASCAQTNTGAKRRSGPPRHPLQTPLGRAGVQQGSQELLQPCQSLFARRDPSLIYPFPAMRWHEGFGEAHLMECWKL